MAIFYVLPPRVVLGNAVADLLANFFPGLDWRVEDRVRLAEVLGEGAESRPGVYVLFREDLPQGEPLPRALVDGFGAEVGDEVVEIRPPGAGPSRRWKVEAWAA